MTAQSHQDKVLDRSDSVKANASAAAKLATEPVTAQQVAVVVVAVAATKAVAVPVTVTVIWADDRLAPVAPRLAAPANDRRRHEVVAVVLVVPALVEVKREMPMKP